MSKRSSKSEALPTLGIAVVSLALASGASASTGSSALECRKVSEEAHYSCMQSSTEDCTRMPIRP